MLKITRGLYKTGEISTNLKIGIELRRTPYKLGLGRRVYPLGPSNLYHFMQRHCGLIDTAEKLEEIGVLPHQSNVTPILEHFSC